MPGDLAKQLADDVRCFLRSGDYYRNLGVPYRRGYLLHGPPGCGKTSFVMALAGELNLSISLLSLANRSVNDEALMELLNSANQSSIVLIEDIDRAFSSESAVSMSGLLNALDGVGAQEGNVVFMTTNHVERLDAALIRPGRADVKLEIGLLDQAQTRKLFHKFYPDAPRSLQDEFAARVPPHTVSPAQIQSHLFFHRDDPGRAVQTVSDFLTSAQSFEKSLEAKRRAAAKMQELPRPPIL
ncbi:mitochondrial chaperone BCS1 [Strigomonas culicis]|uniref:Mitochondrial chaperone BCS1 n=1 Tax=Strigomonas culicis TaxID=28005 RepID=S9WB76_9TRYP|nr:mitochondrial chaperone BCS1 [Strigomonas culicis]|eukprot:EPY33230.1 mitochondrial chaperone BCS1 [Strigomonas culicis]